MAFKYSNGVWVGSDITEMNVVVTNNFSQWGQPYAPGQPGFDPVIYDGWDGAVTVRFSQHDVMTNGYGVGIKTSDFEVARKWASGEYKAPHDGVFTFAELKAMGVFPDTAVVSFSTAT